MADSQDRTLPATQRKLQKAREDGQVARSRDFGHFMAVAACGAMLVALAPTASGWLRQMLMLGLQFNAAGVRSSAFMGERLMALTISMLWVLVPFGDRKTHV